MQNESSILSALQQAVTAAVAASDDPNLPIKYLLLGNQGDGEWVVPIDQKYLELVWVPNNADDFWGDELNHMGLLRLVLHWPNNGGGIYEPVELLASITSYFHKGRMLQSVQVSGKPNPTGPIENGSEILFPVSISYQSFR